MLALVLLVGFVCWWLLTVPVSHSTLQRLSPGMTQSQVYAILGPPNETNASSGDLLWFYSRKSSIMNLMIRFDTNGLKEYVTDY